MKSSTKKLIYIITALAAVLLIAGCDGPAPRRHGGDNAYHSGVLVSVPYSAPGPYQVLLIAPDKSLWEYDDGYIWQCEDRLSIETQPLVKLLDDVVFVDWSLSGKVARTADNGLWLLDGVITGNNHRWLIRIMDDVESVVTGGPGSVVTGDYSIFALKTDGTLWKWTDISTIHYNIQDIIQNSFSKSYDEFVMPPPVFIMDDVKQVSKGMGNPIALKNDGSLWVCSGTTSRCIMDNVAHIFSSEDYHMAIDNDGTLWAWGRNGYGQLGDGTTSDKRSPVKIMEDVKWVETYLYNTFAIKTDESLWAWGEQVGSLLPVMIFDDGIEVLSIRASQFLANSRDVLGDYFKGRHVDEYTLLVNGINIVKADGSLWVISQKDISTSGFEGEKIFVFPPEKKLDDVLYADGGHAVKTDGSLWDVRQGIMILPPGTVLTGEMN